MGKPATIILLNEYSIKNNSSDLSLNLQIRAALKSLQRIQLLFAGQQLTQSALTGQHAENRRQWTALLQMRHTHPPLPPKCRSHGSVVREKILRTRSDGFTSVNQRFRIHQGSAHMNAQQSQQLLKVYTSSSQTKIPAWRGMVGPNPTTI